MDATKIAISLLDSQGQNIVVTGQANTMTLQLTLSGGACALLPDEFKIGLNLGALYNDRNNQQNIEIQGDGFAAVFVSGQFPAWVLSPAETIDWGGAQPSLTFTLSNLVPEVGPTTASYFVTLADEATSQGKQMNGTVFVQNLPSPPPSAMLPVSVTFTTNAPVEVAITRTPAQTISNTLTLQLRNNSAQSLVTQPWGNVPPSFSLWFCTAPEPPGYYALTTPDLLATVTVSPVSAGNWKVIASDGPSGPYWVLQPTTSNKGVIGTGTNAIAEFTVTGLETQFAPGPTIVYVQYNDFPGSGDSVLTSTLEKGYLPMSLSFSMNQNYAFNIPECGYATAYLGWNVQNAVLVELECVPPVAPLDGSAAVPPVATAGYGPVAFREASYPVMIQENQTFVLTAYDTVCGQIGSATVTAVTNPILAARWIPCGLILAWYGALEDVPAGFAVCDGASGSGTPDLRDKFILGAGSGYPPGPMPPDGDQHTHLLSGFNFKGVATTSDGAHSHPMPPAWKQRDLDTPFSGPSFTGIDVNGSYAGSTTQNYPSHSHTVDILFGSPASSVNSGGVRPPWYALYYMMKTYQ